MKRSLVTGASGFVGHHLLKLLAERNIQADGIGHTEASDLPNCSTVDLLDPKAVEAIDFTQYDAVYHLAGLAAVGKSFDHPRRYIDANATMQINVLETCLAQVATPRVLVISTGGVYGARTPPIPETAPADPTNPYTVSKITQEALAQYYHHRGLEVIIARAFNHIGPGQGLGFIVPDLASQIIEAEYNQSNTIQVGNLNSKRDYTDVRDIVKAYLALIQDGKAGEIYNVCSGASVSGEVLLAGLQKAAGTSLRIEQDPARNRPSDIPDAYGSYKKLHRDTGWEPTIPLKQTLAEVMNDWRERRSQS